MYLPIIQKINRIRNQNARFFLFFGQVLPLLGQSALEKCDKTHQIVLNVHARQVKQQRRRLGHEANGLFVFVHDFHEIGVLEKVLGKGYFRLLSA